MRYTARGDVEVRVHVNPYETKQRLGLSAALEVDDGAPLLVDGRAPGLVRPRQRSTALPAGELGTVAVVPVCRRNAFVMLAALAGGDPEAVVRHERCCSGVAATRCLPEWVAANQFAWRYVR
jgi:hypothetical protein